MKDPVKNIIVVIIPTYNEAQNIGLLIDELFGNCFPGIDADMRILVVDGGSQDGTCEIVCRKMKQFPELSFITGIGKGLGFAYVHGMRYAMEQLNADAVIEMDADFQHNPKYLKDLVSAFLSGGDYIIGSRFVDGGGIPLRWEWHHRIISRYGNRFAKAVLQFDKIHDITTGFRLTRVEGVLARIDLEALMALDCFAYKIDLLYRILKVTSKVVEVPIIFQRRICETSKYSMKEAVESIKVIFMIRIEMYFKCNEKQ